MKATPKVTVVTAFLEAEKFLRDSMESVCAQRYDNWEMILVDAGSQDGSPAIARGFATRSPDKIRVIEHDGQVRRGISASRNLGLRQARGELVAFLDAEDTWLPQKLEAQVAILQLQPNAVMVYGPTRFWNSGNGDDADPIQDIVVGGREFLEPPSVLTTFLWDDRRAPRTCSALIRRDAALAVGGFEGKFTAGLEDQAFFAKLCLRNLVSTCDECLDRCRQRKDKADEMASVRGQHRQRLEFLDWLSEYVARHEVMDAELQSALHITRQWALHPVRHRVTNGARHSARAVRRGVKRSIRAVARGVLPDSTRRWIWGLVTEAPPVGSVRFGHLRRFNPISEFFGFDRGQPIDRYYIDRFLTEFTADVKGHVLEVGEDMYTRQYGGDRVTRSDVVHYVEGNPKATIVADLTKADHISSDTFDCIIITQTLQMIFDQRAALRHLHRILKPGGVVLMTTHGLSRIGRHKGRDAWGCYWHMTTQAASALFPEFFPPGNVTVRGYGNLLATVSFLHGLASQELKTEELDHYDRDYEILVAVRAIKA